jgi:hypothetical protein
LLESMKGRDHFGNQMKVRGLLNFILLSDWLVLELFNDTFSAA